jgi:hypothetical protein
MEHVGRHYENAIATGEDVSQSAWNRKNAKTYEPHSYSHSRERRQ